MTDLEKIEVLRGALSFCVQQIEQMRGMFDDGDGQIQQALDDASDALDATE